MASNQGAISIHALREEGDLLLRFNAPDRIPISIHALREEGDQVLHSLVPIPGQFLSTPSARRATPFRGFPQVCNEISIHALREEGDAIKSLGVDGNTVFLSTPSARRATSDGTV